MSEVRELHPVGHVYQSGAVVTAHYRAWSPLDNHEPARRETVVMLEEITWPPSADGFVGVEMEIIRGLEVFRHAANALWIIDDGETTRVMHTATWHTTRLNVGLKSFPAGLPGGFGPRTTYHLMTKGV